MNAVLYISSSLPALSETFVYREVFALRERAWCVPVASLHAPSPGEDPALNGLAQKAVPVYSRGGLRLCADAAGCVFARPIGSMRALALAGWDALTGRDVSLAGRAKLVIQAVAALALVHRLGAADIGHIHSHMAHAPTSVAMYAAECLGIPFSFTGHANDIFVHRSLLSRKLRRAAFVRCISHWHREFYRSITPLDDDRLPVIRCGVPLPPAVDRPHSVGNTKIITVARLVPKKGIDVLVGALARMHDAGPWMCEIIGDGPERQRLERLVADRGVTDRVRFAGSLPNDQVQQRLARADIFVLPCRVDAAGDRDGVPVAMMEAMAHGVCTIGGDLPAIRELMIPRGSPAGEAAGVLVPPGDDAALERELRRVLADPAERRRLAGAGRAWVREEFSLVTTADRLADALNGRPRTADIVRRPTPVPIPE